MPGAQATLAPPPAALGRWDELPRLAAMLDAILPRNRFWNFRLGGTPLPSGPDQFARLPLSSNRDLSRDLNANPPYGSNLSEPLRAYCRFHQTSGTAGRPLAVLDTAASWEWWLDCWDAVLDAAGLTKRDLAFFAFSFAPFIGFWSAFEAVLRRGTLAVPGGGASTDRRLSMIRELKCTALFSTPTYALRMAGRARALGMDLAAGPVRRVILAGEPGGSVPATRRRIAMAWGAKVFDHAGASEVGAYGVPCPQGRGVFVNEREFIAEFLPVNGERIGEGGIAELVITNLGRACCPVIRYRTGDLVRPRRLPEGLLLEGGVLGRSDHMMLVRGVNLHPSAIEEAVRRVADLAEFRITVERTGEMDEARVEVESSRDACEAIAHDVRNIFGVRIEVEPVPEGTLPNWEAKAQRFRDLRR